MADSHEAQLEANVARIQHYVDNLFAVKHRTAKQDAALAHDLDTLARNERALAAYRAEYHEPPVEAIPVGPDPLPVLGTIDQTYGCPPDFDREAFESRYGFSIEVAMSKVLTGLLRPNLDRWQALVASSGGTFSQQTADYYKNGDVTKQKAAIAFCKGEIPFSGVASYFGGWVAELGCADLTQLKDLGAA